MKAERTTPSAAREFRRYSSVDSPALALGRSLALIAALVGLWSFLHLYKGLTGDAELYALQAFARTNPSLASDLYLQNVSQDHFTYFSPLYSWFIELLGLQRAAIFMISGITVGFFVAAWFLARSLSGPKAAFFAVASLIALKGHYGSFGVFTYSENYLTARTLAEAMVVTAIACHVTNHKRLALMIGATAMLVHPIMALPGLLLLACLAFPARLILTGALAGVALVFAVAVLRAWHPATTGLLASMDPVWLEIVQERSQFLFLQLWTAGDWQTNGRPFLYLAMAALSLDLKARNLAVAAIIVGACGLMVAAIAGLVGPVALLVQGQAWRWLWITSFTSILLMAPTAFKVWGDSKCGPLCALLLVLGLTFPIAGPNTCVAAALFLWVVRKHISDSTARHFNWAAAGLASVVLVWLVANAWTIVGAPSPDSGRDSAFIAHLRNVLGLDAAAPVAVLSVYALIRSVGSKAPIYAVALILSVGAAYALRGSFTLLGRDGTPAETKLFADWRTAIPPGANVFVVPARNSATFAWFTLERPSYLALDQSAGIVFSRATALEVRRRAENLLPVRDPDWRLLSRNRQIAAKPGKQKDEVRALTLEGLRGICRDSALDFVVATEALELPFLQHARPGAAKAWNLYDCRQIRFSTGSPA